MNLKTLDDMTFTDRLFNEISFQNMDSDNQSKSKGTKKQNKKHKDLTEGSHGADQIQKSLKSKLSSCEVTPIEESAKQVSHLFESILFLYYAHRVSIERKFPYKESYTDNSH